jgi:putative lumazine-binding protein
MKLIRSGYRASGAQSALCAAILLLGFASLHAQSADEKTVQAAVESFLTRLGNHQFETLDADFAPKAIIVVTRQRGDQWVNSLQTAEEWIAALKKNPNPATFREPITNVKITIDSGQLAYLRADFQVVRDGAVLSSGVDQFTLVREGGAWKIAAAAYTSIPAPR